MERHSTGSTSTGRAGQVWAGWEPSLAEMLHDPVVQALMAVDRVSPTDIVTLMSEAQERVAARTVQ